MKQTVEILPGIRIEVNRSLKRMAGVSSSQMRATAIGTPAAAFAKVQRSQRKGILYSRLILDEAVALEKERGLAEAVRLTGVNKWSIDKRKREMRREAGLATRSERGHRYTMEQKRACVELALRLMASPETVAHVANVKGRKMTRVRPKWCQRPAFKEAGRRLGLNGRSVEWMWKQGMLEPSTPPLPLPPVQQ